MSSRLQVRKIFVYQAFTPLIYNAGIILGAVLLHNRLGIYSLAIGVLAGVILGSALLNTLGAFRTGLRYHPARQLPRSRLPRVAQRSRSPSCSASRSSCSTASSSTTSPPSDVGGITLIGNAKDLFNAPFNVIGPAAGAASLPFFAALFQQKRAYRLLRLRRPLRLPPLRRRPARLRLDDRPRPLAHGPLPRRQVQSRRRRSPSPSSSASSPSRSPSGPSRASTPAPSTPPAIPSPPPSPAPSSPSPPSRSTGCSSTSAA